MRLPRIVTLLSVIVFVASLTQTACYISGESGNVSFQGEPFQGISVLLLGARILFDLLVGAGGLFFFEWLANPVLAAGWVFSFAGKNKVALLLGILASALMVAFLFRHTVPDYKIIRYGVGYWLWLTSGVLMIVSGATGLAQHR
jgi:hypothetical protein